MDGRLGERIAHTFITVLVFGIGLLIGGRYCGPEPAPDDAPGVTQQDRADASTDPSRPTPPPAADTCPECPAPQIVYQCPPEPTPEPRDGSGEASKPKKEPRKSLPPEPELDPLARKRLLAWVRDQSDVLAACRDDAQDLYRMAVILHLDATSARVVRVDVNASRGEVPAAVLSCVRQNVRQWKPPGELTQGRTQLVFGLTI